MQKTITKDHVLQIEQYAENYEAYKKILTFAEDVSLDRLFYRLDSLAVIFKFKNEALTLMTFEKFEDIEKYIFENRDEFLLATDQKLTSAQFASFDKKKLGKYLNLQIPDLTGSRRDKVVKMITSTNVINNSFSNIVNVLKNWLLNEKSFKVFNIDLEQLKDFSELLTYLQQSGHYQSCHQFIKKLKPELSKDLSDLDKKKILEKVYIETDISKYDPLFEQSHNYTSLDLFIQDFNSYFKVLEYKSFLETVNTLKAPIVFEDCVPNTKTPKTLIIEIKNFDQIGKIGCSSWCLTRSREQWNSYVGNHQNSRKFFIVYGFQKKSPNHIFGVTYDTVAKSAPYCQNYDNKPVPVPPEYIKMFENYCVVKPSTPIPPLVRQTKSDDMIRQTKDGNFEIIRKRNGVYEYKDYNHEINRYMIDSAERFFGAGAGIVDTSGSVDQYNQYVDYVDGQYTRYDTDKREKELDKVLEELKKFSDDTEKNLKKAAVKEEDVKKSFEKMDHDWKENFKKMFKMR